MANWEQNLDALWVLPLSIQFMAKAPSSLVQPSSHLTIRLYAKRSSHPDILIGTHEMPIPLTSQRGSFCREISFRSTIEHLACRYLLCPRDGEQRRGSSAVDATGHTLHNGQHYTPDPVQQPPKCAS